MLTQRALWAERTPKIRRLERDPISVWLHTAVRALEAADDLPYLNQWHAHYVDHRHPLSVYSGLYQAARQLPRPQMDMRLRLLQEKRDHLLGLHQLRIVQLIFRRELPETFARAMPDERGYQLASFHCLCGHEANVRLHVARPRLDTYRCARCYRSGGVALTPQPLAPDGLISQVRYSIGPWRHEHGTHVIAA